MPASDTDFLFAEVRLGVAMREFLATPVGSYLLGRAQQAVESAQKELLAVSASDADMIRDLQMQGRAAQLLMQWVGDAITNGDASEQQLYELESEHDG